MKTKKGEINKIFLMFLVIMVLLFGIYISTYVNLEKKQIQFESDELNESAQTLILSECGDGTLLNSCSNKKPYFCDEGILIRKASLCGCPDGFLFRKDKCVSDYKTNPREIELDYVLRGEKNTLNFTVYDGVYDYLAGLPREMTTIESVPTLTDFKYRNLEEDVQEEFLLDLVVEIMNLAPSSKEDQARIAISIVQNIPYGFSDKNSSFSYGTIDIGYTRYPYETLYDQEGLCGEKSELLVFLLKKIGYDAVFLRYFEENHEVVGIKCPKEFSLYGSGYCFVESTRPNIMTNSFDAYIGIGELESIPVILDTSDNHLDSLPEDMYEYKDAREWVTVNKALNSFFGWMNKRNKDKKEILKLKYGL